MLAFFTDSQLTRRLSMFTPKLFCVPDDGGTRSTTLYIGDPYTATVQQACAIGGTVLYLDQTTEFPASGSALIGTMLIAYTGTTAKSLTGVTGVTAAVAVGTTVMPDITYTFQSNIVIAVAGADAIGIESQLAVSLKLPTQTSYGFRGTALIMTTNVLSPTTPIAVDVQVRALPGADQLFENVSIICSGALKQQNTTPSPDSSAPAQRITAVAPVNVYRHNQGLPQHERLLPITRQVSPDLPGFIVGQSRWREDTSINASALVPTNWNVNIPAIGNDKFTSGIASTDDLDPISVESYENSLYLRVQNGFYFTGPNRFFLPAGYMLEFLNSQAPPPPSGVETVVPTILSYTLLQSPRSQTTVYVGTWALDSNGFYQKATTYRYVGSQFQPAVSDNQFTLDRTARLLTLNQPMPEIVVLLGPASGQAIDYFDIPTYPVANVRAVYVDQGAPLGNLYANAFTFDKVDGTIHVPLVAGALIGQPIYAVCDPAVAVLYEQDGAWKPDYEYAMDVVINVNDVIYRVVNPGKSGQVQPTFAATLDAITQDGSPPKRVLRGIGAVVPRAATGLQWVCQGPCGTRRLPADLNPAYSGIASGFVYLLHSRIEPQVLELAVDKPLIAVPPVGNNPVGLLAYGPVYASGDYALLIATAYDGNQNPIPNVQLQVVPAPGFDGLINYQDPTSTTVLVRTGGDGTANLIYTPNKNFGQYLPNTAPTPSVTVSTPGGVSTTHVVNDTLNLSEPVELSQLYNTVEGWLTTLYSITDDIGLYGKIGANVAEGEIAFVTSGTPGSPSYKTNGRMIAWLNGSTPVVPIAGYDSADHLMTDPEFSGRVVKVVFATALPAPASLAAYFFTYIDRVSLSLAVVDSNIVSNSVLLQIQPPALIPDNPWLILDDAINGKLDVFRLGWTANIDSTPTTALI